MKKTCISIFICLSLLLCGCRFSGKRIKEPVNFYYLRDVYNYYDESGVIGQEIREASGHRDSLSYLLALYRMGPSSEDLRLPFPEGTAILMMEQTDTYVHMALGDAAATMSDTEFSLACVCLTLTCTELTDVQQVTVTNGQQTLTLSRDSIAILDTGITNATEETQ